jgi:hypothetical protein
MNKGDLVYITPWYNDNLLGIVKTKETSYLYTVVRLDNQKCQDATYHINALVPFSNWPPPWLRPLTTS